MDKPPSLLLDTIFILLFCAGNVYSEECSGYLDNQYVKESCSAGGCCVPSDGNGDTLCCIPTLTIILVSVFVGGAIVVIIVIIICCVVCRYQNKRKNRQRQEERRRRQREQDEERQRRLMQDPFVNGDPFLVPTLAQPPRYHGEPADPSQPTGRSASRTRQAPQPLTEIPPPYPKSPPPAYYSRIANHEQNPQTVTNNPNGSRVSTPMVIAGTSRGRVTTSGNQPGTSRERSTNSRLQSRSDLTAADIQIADPSAPTEAPNTPYPRASTETPNTPYSRASTSYNNNQSRVSRNIPSVSRAYSSRNTQSSITIEDLESNVTDAELGQIFDVESRMSSAKYTEMEYAKPSSRNSSKADSRMSSGLRVMSAIHEDGTFTKTPTRSRGRFIKSTLSNISEDTTVLNSAMTYTTSRNDRAESRASSMQSYIRTVDPDEPAVSNYHYV